MKLFTKIAIGSVAGIAALATIGNIGNGQSLASCNAGNVEACSDVFDGNGTNKSMITNKAYLAKAKADESKPALTYGENAKKPTATKIVKVDYAKKQKELLAAAETKGEWAYRTYSDDATGKQAKTANLTSKNSMNFDFPYRGTQYGTFTIRNHPRHGVDAFLSIRKGQLLCDSYNNPTVLVRFDNGAASSYSCNSPADHSSETVFIEGVGRLEGRMKTAKKMYVTVSVYGEGSRTWEFNVRNYDRSKV